MFFPSAAALSSPAACAGVVLFVLGAGACAQMPPDWKFSGFDMVDAELLVD